MPGLSYIGGFASKAYYLLGVPIVFGNQDEDRKKHTEVDNSAIEYTD